MIIVIQVTLLVRLSPFAPFIVVVFLTGLKVFNVNRIIMP